MRARHRHHRGAGEIPLRPPRRVPQITRRRRRFLPDERDIDILSPTEFIESDAPRIVALSASLRRGTPVETAVALFDWVRDNVRYDPRSALDGRGEYRATRVLERGHGFCIQKAVLLAALLRASGIPSRLGFADVRNHKTPAWLREFMGTDVFVFHGYVEIPIDGKWVKATPAFDAGASRKAGVLPVTLDGANDAMFHPVDPEGHPFIEYIRSRGAYDDLPYAEIIEEFGRTYPALGKVLTGTASSSGTSLR